MIMFLLIISIFCATTVILIVWNSTLNSTQLNFKLIKVLLLITTVAFCVSVVFFYKSTKVSRAPATLKIVEDTRFQDINGLAKANGFEPSERIVDAIIRASDVYDIDALELTAIGIIETGLGKYNSVNKNNNGTQDKGVFQINTVNYPKCVEYNLDSPEGSALCAAKLLSSIKAHRADYLGVYHSKTPSRKTKYLNKVTKVLNVAYN